MIDKLMDNVKTKIVVTLGPSSIDKVQEIANFVDVFRINFAHGDEDSHKLYFEKAKDTVSSVLVDLPGPKLRIGELKDKIILRKGDDVVFSQSDGIPVEDPLFYEAVQENHDILLADGTIRVRITEVEKDKLKGKVLEGGTLTSRKGINIPDAKLKVGLTDNDVRLMKEAINLGADFIGLSFVLSSEDVKRAKSIVGDRAWIIAKIEKKEAVDRIKEIVYATDGIMVARGDLGVEIGLQNLPIAQRRIIRLSKVAGRPVILATQVLESMVNSPIPTRAEVIDVANSIVQGVDAIMLSDETAAGNFPIESVKYLHDTIKAVEPHVRSRRPKGTNNEDDAIALAGVNAADVSSAVAIVVHSRSGSSIVRVSRLRPKQPIIGLCPDEGIARRLRLCWGVSPIAIQKAESINEVIELAERNLIKGLKGKIVLLGGDPAQEEGKTNFLMIMDKT